MREQTAEVENAGATMYGKPSEENTLKYRRKYGCRGIHAYLLPNATHKRVGLLTLLLSNKQVGTSKQCSDLWFDNTQHQNDDDASDDASTPTTVPAHAAVDFCEMSCGTA